MGKSRTNSNKIGGQLMATREMICIVCPVGCHLEVNEETLEVTGNRCPRGAVYGKKELTNPTRMLTSTVKTNARLQNRVSVKTSDEIPKGKIFEIMEALNQIEAKVPVKIGDVLHHNILDTGIDIIATTTLLD